MLIFLSSFGGSVQNDAYNDIMKENLAIDPLHILNIYISKQNNGVYGYATFPLDDYESEHPNLSGVIIHKSTLPGGDNTIGWNQGGCLVHEVGHFMGLLHTFTNGCDGDGDFAPLPGDHCADTPTEAYKHYDCPPDYTDTCPEDLGYDPIHNYMDYTSDDCRTNPITSDQIVMVTIQYGYL